MSLRRIFSGIQPTGVPHIGNYLGAIRNWVHLQNTAKNNELLMFCVVDLHSCTTNHAAQQLNDNIYNMVAALLACGIDPNKSLLFQQSQVILVYDLKAKKTKLNGVVCDDKSNDFSYTENIG